jgi:hypothetical protein
LWYSHNVNLVLFVTIVGKFVQGYDVFICDFVVVIKMCQVDLFMMYFNPMNGFQCQYKCLLWCCG